MQYFSLVASLISIVLAGVYLFLTVAPLWSRILIAGLMTLSFGWTFGFVVRFIIGVFILIYRSYIKARAFPT